MVDKKELNDVIVLGRAAPDEIKDGRQTVCVGGWSDELEEFIRIYPTTVRSDLKRWNNVTITVERNEKDTRKESWKIRGSNTEWDKLHQKITVNDRLERDDWIQLSKRLPKSDCIEDLNIQKRSLGLIELSEIIDSYFENRDDYNPSQPTKLDEFFGEAEQKVFRVRTKQNFPVVPKIKWKCVGPCQLQQGYHETQVLEWGVYEWIRKNEDDPEKWTQVWDNLRLYDDDYKKYFFVGNLNRYRRTFVIISIIRWKVSENNDDNQEALDKFF